MNFIIKPDFPQKIIQDVPAGSSLPVAVREGLCITSSRFVKGLLLLLDLLSNLDPSATKATPRTL
jgi:hypothetical protein